MIPTEVQGYIRHLLHIVGMALVARAGYNGEFAEIFAAAGVNGLALGWFLYTEYKKKKAAKNVGISS